MSKKKTKRYLIYDICKVEIDKLVRRSQNGRISHSNINNQTHKISRSKYHIKKINTQAKSDKKPKEHTN